ncbi:MAG: FAD:protein FMN transferase [Gaiellaceae bacterium]
MNRLLDRTVFGALGTTCSLAVATSPVELPAARRVAAAIRTEVDECARILSRFDPTSDLSRVNDASGEWVGVDERLVDAVGVALWFRTATGGRCDPTLLPALVAGGYARSFELLDDRPPGGATSARGDVEVDRAGGRVRVAKGVAIDLGATAKGWIAARALALARRAWPALPGALLDLGGDIAVVGAPPEGGAWRIDVEDPRAPAALLGTLRLERGGVATSGPSRRRFGPGDSLHHLIDPGRRAPMVGGPLAVTVVAADPVAAEAHSTALAVTRIEEVADYVSERPGLGTVVLSDDGHVFVLGELDFSPARRAVVA